MHRNLRSFLDLLRRENHLTTIEVEVDPYLELAEIHRRVIAAGGPALLFKRVKGSPFPVATNLFGTKRRVDLAFGERPREFVRAAAEVPHTLLPPSLGRMWNARSFLSQGLRLGTTSRRRAP